jgi:hypothetical protein
MQLKQKAKDYFIACFAFCSRHSAGIGGFAAIVGVILGLYGCYGSTKTDSIIKQNQKVMEELVKVIEPLTTDQLKTTRMKYIPIPLKKPEIPEDFLKAHAPTKQSSKIIAACIMLASKNYNIPPAVMIGIYKKEGGRLGEEYKRKNGSYDLGPMKINSTKIPMLAEKWGVNEKTAYAWVKDDACTNLGVATWILSNFFSETKNLREAIGKYDENPKTEKKYASDVIDILNSNGLIKK